MLKLNDPSLLKRQYYVDGAWIGAGVDVAENREGRALRERNAGPPEPIRAIAWKAQTRLCAKFRRLAGVGKHTAKIVAAAAHELAGFIWDIARHTPVPVSREFDARCS